MLDGFDFKEFIDSFERNRFCFRNEEIDKCNRDQCYRGKEEVDFIVLSVKYINGEVCNNEILEFVYQFSFIVMNSDCKWIDY